MSLLPPVLIVIEQYVCINPAECIIWTQSKFEGNKGLEIVFKTPLSLDSWFDSSIQLRNPVIQKLTLVLILLCRPSGKNYHVSRTQVRNCFFLLQVDINVSGRTLCCCVCSESAFIRLPDSCDTQCLLTEMRLPVCEQLRLLLLLFVSTISVDMPGTLPWAVPHHPCKHRYVSSHDFVELYRTISPGPFTCSLFPVLLLISC